MSLTLSCSKGNRKCSCCGKINLPSIPREFQTGYGPRLTAFIAELAGGQGDSRTMVQDLCASVFNFSISLGAIQKVLDRASEALMPHYEAIGVQARRQAVNHADETPWYLKGVLYWLWDDFRGRWRGDNLGTRIKPLARAAFLVAFAVDALPVRRDFDLKMIRLFCARKVVIGQTAERTATLRADVLR